MMSRSSARDSYAAKRPPMTITCCRSKEMSACEKARQGAGVEMPQGFSKEGHALKLKKSLHGSGQSPRNFFMCLKENLEAVGFKPAADVCF